MTVIGAVKFERFFRDAAGLDVDQADLKRYSDFVNRKLYDLLVVGRAAASANGRDVIFPSDLPITKGLQQSIHDFREIEDEAEVPLQPILAQLATLPPLEMALAVETEERLPTIVGGLSVALARTFKIVDPHVKNPQTRQWEAVFRIFDLLL
jgi:hypothetical protein